MITGRIHSTESFGSVDGPGVRFVIFLQGCRLRCRYCHNPDTWDLQGGEERTASDLLDTAERYRSYWGREGGITVSGGEPLLQMDFLLDLFRNAKLRGINTCVDTAGQPFTREEPFFSAFKELCRLTDLFIADIKHIDPRRHSVKSGANIPARRASAPAGARIIPRSDSAPLPPSSRRISSAARSTAFSATAGITTATTSSATASST